MDKNVRIITNIIEYIEIIFNTQKRFGNDFNVFVSDKDYFNSVCMSLLQIGELANHLTEEFAALHKDIPWKNIIGLRNVLVHGYRKLDTEVVWATVMDDIPELYKKIRIITKNSN